VAIFKKESQELKERFEIEGKMAYHNQSEVDDEEDNISMSPPKKTEEGYILYL